MPEAEISQSPNAVSPSWPRHQSPPKVSFQTGPIFGVFQKGFLCYSRMEKTWKNSLRFYFQITNKKRGVFLWDPPTTRARTKHILQHSLSDTEDPLHGFLCSNVKKIGRSFISLWCLNWSDVNSMCMPRSVVSSMRSFASMMWKFLPLVTPVPVHYSTGMINQASWLINERKPKPIRWALCNGIIISDGEFLSKFNAAVTWWFMIVEKKRGEKQYYLRIECVGQSSPC